MDFLDSRGIMDRELGEDLWTMINDRDSFLM